MKKLLLSLLLALTLSCHQQSPKPSPLVAKTPLERQHTTTHRIGIFDQFEGNPKKNLGEVGHCSGTSVGRHAILTAQHCFKDSNLIRLDAEQKTTTIMAVFVDGNDHVIYIVDHDFDTWADVTQRALVDGEHVHFWGSPGKNTDVYRVGYYVWSAPEPEIDKKFRMQKFVLPTYAGDSGSGIFDEAGKVVAVITFADESADELSEPLQFTDAQLEVVKELD